MNPSSLDVLGLGVVAIDDLLYVESYPPADESIRVDRRERQCGGLTATALVAAARLGSNCAYAGALGDDERSRFVLDRFACEGIDTSNVVHDTDACPINSTIVVDSQAKTRTKFVDVPGRVGADPRQPDESVIRAAKVLLADPFGTDGMIRAVTIARESGNAVVGDFERDRAPRFYELLGLVDHLILSRNAARKFSGASDADSAVKSLWNENRAVVIVTLGVEGCLAVTESTLDSPTRFPAFPVETVDTTGCGDVFHGAYASALARGWTLEDRIRFASAAAAIKSTKPGGQSGIPDLETVDSFLEERAE